MSQFIAPIFSLPKLASRWRQLHAKGSDRRSSLLRDRQETARRSPSSDSASPGRLDGAEHSINWSPLGSSHKSSYNSSVAWIENLKIQEHISEKLRVRTEIGFEPDMPTEFPDDGTIDELLCLAGVSTERSAARRWLESALVAARGTPEPRLVPHPAPAKHNAKLDEIERASNRLIAALKQLRSHPHA